MLAEDVQVFLFLFLGMFANYGLVLMVVFPKTKSEEVITQVPLFNNPAGAVSMAAFKREVGALSLNTAVSDLSLARYSAPIDARARLSGRGVRNQSCYRRW